MAKLWGSLFVFFLGRCIYLYSLFVASDFFHIYRIPILYSIFFLLLGAGLALLTIHQYWQAINSRSFTRNQIIVLILNGLCMSLSFGLFNFGLKYAGPLRTLAFGYSDYLISSIRHLRTNPRSGNKYSLTTWQRRAMWMMLIAYIILLFFTSENSVHDLDLLSTGVSLEKSLALHNFKFLWFTFSEAKVGSWALFLSTLIELQRKKFARAKSKDFGGRRRFHAWSMVTAATLLSIPVLSLYLTSSSVAPSSLDTSNPSSPNLPSPSPVSSLPFSSASEHLTFSTLMTVYLYLIVFYVLLDCYLETFSIQVGTSLNGVSSNGTPVSNNTHGHQLLVKRNAVASFIIISLINMVRGEERLTEITFVSWLLILVALHWFLNEEKEGTAMSLSGPRVSASEESSWFHHLLGLSGESPSALSDEYYGKGKIPTSSSNYFASFIIIRSELNLIWRHIMADGESKRIFLYFCINLSFMFVELIYGFLTNSLGLISDAGHMLFDCAALAIGLYASYVANVKANSTYTYGYGRYKVLSGFINGVFLFFIGYFVFVEAVERLFEKPEIYETRLIAVSVLGFIVNLIGLCFFHDHAHSHGDDGHGHSHGGGHSCPSHGASNKKKTTKRITSSTSPTKDVKHVQTYPQSDIKHNQSHKHGSTSPGGHNHSHGSHYDHDHDHNDHNDHDCDDGHNHSHDGGHNHSHDGGHNHSHDGGHNHSHDGGHNHSHDGGCDGHHDSHGHSHGPTNTHHDEDEHSDFEIDVHGGGASEEENLNMQVIFLHILADTLGSVGVIISSILIHYFKWFVADAICSIVISFLIILSVIPAIKSSALVLLQRTPSSKQNVLRESLRKITHMDGVISYRESHFWVNATDLVGTIHVHVKEDAEEQRLLNQINGLLKAQAVGCSHLSVQLEKENFLSNLKTDERLYQGS